MSIIMSSSINNALLVVIDKDANLANQLYLKNIYFMNYIVSLDTKINQKLHKTVNELTSNRYKFIKKIIISSDIQIIKRLILINSNLRYVLIADSNEYSLTKYISDLDELWQNVHSFTYLLNILDRLNHTEFDYLKESTIIDDIHFSQSLDIDDFIDDMIIEQTLFYSKKRISKLNQPRKKIGVRIIAYDKVNNTDTIMPYLVSELKTDPTIYNFDIALNITRLTDKQYYEALDEYQNTIDYKSIKEDILITLNCSELNINTLQNINILQVIHSIYFNALTEHIHILDDVFAIGTKRVILYLMLLNRFKGSYKPWLNVRKSNFIDEKYYDMPKKQYDMMSIQLIEHLLHFADVVMTNIQRIEYKKTTKQMTIITENILDIPKQFINAFISLKYNVDVLNLDDIDKLDKSDKSYIEKTGDIIVYIDTEPIDCITKQFNFSVHIDRIGSVKSRSVDRAYTIDLDIDELTNPIIKTAALNIDDYSIRSTHNAYDKTKTLVSIDLYDIDSNLNPNLACIITNSHNKGLYAMANGILLIRTKESDPALEHIFIENETYIKINPKNQSKKILSIEARIKLNIFHKDYSHILMRAFDISKGCGWNNLAFKIANLTPSKHKI